MINTKQFYKGAELHAHYSAYVSTKTLLDLVSNPKWCSANGIGFTYQDNTIRITNNSNNFIKTNIINVITTKIQNAWKGSSDKKFSIVGDIFYYLIKDSRFYQHYINLIAMSMIEQEIDHLELRLKFGSGLYNGSKPMSIEEELRLLNTCIMNANKNIGPVSIKFIACVSKGTKKNISIYPIFKDIIDIIIRNNYYSGDPRLGTLIVGLDIVGPEDSGNSLRSYSKDLHSTRDYMLANNILIPYVFHAGEHNSEQAHILDNIRVAIEFHDPRVQTRIGHGIQVYKDKNLVRDIIKNDIILEVCPISNIKLNNYNRNIIPELLENCIRYCLNSDDTNKLNNTNLNDNYAKYADILTKGYPYLNKDEIYKELLLASRISILGSYCSTETRKLMLKKWEIYNRELYKPLLRYITHYDTTSIDNKLYYYHMSANKEYKDLCTKDGYNHLITMGNSLTPILRFLTSTWKDNIEMIIRGYRIYTTKAINKRYGTWSNIQYSDPGFVYVYFRIKSVQRFTEIWNMLERAHIMNILPQIIQKVNRIVSIGGGPGIELYAIDTFIKLYYNKDISYISIDPNTQWKPIVEKLGYMYQNGTFDTYTPMEQDLILLSYIYHYIPSTDYIINLAAKTKGILSNERYPISDIKGISLISDNDYRQVYIGNVENILNPISLVSYSNSPYIDTMIDLHTVIRPILSVLDADEKIKLNTPYGNCVCIGSLYRTCVFDDDVSWKHAIAYATNNEYRNLDIVSKALYNVDIPINIPIYMIEPDSWNMLYTENNITYRYSYYSKDRPKGIVLIHNEKWDVLARIKDYREIYIW